MNWYDVYVRPAIDADMKWHDELVRMYGKGRAGDARYGSRGYATEWLMWLKQERDELCAVMRNAFSRRRGES